MRDETQCCTSKLISDCGLNETCQALFHLGPLSRIAAQHNTTALERYLYPHWLLRARSNANSKSRSTPARRSVMVCLMGKSGSTPRAASWSPLTAR